MAGQGHYGAGPLGGPEAVLPASVRRASRLLLICAGLTMLAGAFLLATASLSPLGLVGALVLLGLGAFEARVASLLRAFVSWARTAAFVLAALGCVVAFLPSGPSRGTPVTFLLHAGVAFFLLRADARAVFGGTGARGRSPDRGGKPQEPERPRP